MHQKKYSVQPVAEGTSTAKKIQCGKLKAPQKYTALYMLV